MNRIPHILGAPLLAAALSAPAWAGPGHDHDHDEAPAAAGPALPRFVAQSELFELVGVLEGKQLTLYLDLAASNEPVTQAELELEIGGAKHKAQAQADGSFRIELPQALQPGLTPVTATVSTADEADLLAGELDLHGDDHAHEAGAFNWKPWAGGLLAAAVGAGVFWARRGKTGYGSAA